MEERPCVLLMSAGDTNIDYQQQCFEAFCKNVICQSNDKTSKMISKDNGQKILRLLKSDPVAMKYSSQLKFWVKKAWVSAHHLTCGLGSCTISRMHKSGCTISKLVCNFEISNLLAQRNFQNCINLQIARNIYKGLNDASMPVVLV